MVSAAKTWTWISVNVRVNQKRKINKCIDLLHHKPLLVEEKGKNKGRKKEGGIIGRVDNW